jgi:hypothetical protein
LRVVELSLIMRRTPNLRRVNQSLVGHPAGTRAGVLTFLPLRRKLGCSDC